MLTDRQQDILQKILRGRAIVYALFAACLTLFTGIATLLIAMQEIPPTSLPLGFTTAGWLSIAYFTYWTVWALRMRRQLTTLKSHEVSGYGLRSEAQYHHHIQTQGRTYPTAATSTLARYIEIAGVKYVYPRDFGFLPEDRPLHLLYVTLSSPWWRGKLSRIIVGGWELTGDALRDFEKTLGRFWNTDDLNANQQGHVSPRQRHALYRDLLLYLWIGLGFIVGCAFIAWLFYGLNSWDDYDSWIGRVLPLAFCMGGACFGCYFLVDTMRDALAIRTAPLHRIQATLEKRQVTPGGTVADGGVSLWDDEQRYSTAPENMIQRIPQSRAAHYYYVDLRGNRKIVNFEIM